ncbi:hypothetical protein DICVIV_07644 [Dictyocaulus viviparus]|uniref:Uncharacterized protein n=1 Tax=Dictyocaulus viviparus TaxID=29172 RepID=A0A0D8XVC1_DICVI|nr:hypothetical protein DICVIV_07644 [Dictyocaulus viviparus]
MLEFTEQQHQFFSIIIADHSAIMRRKKSFIANGSTEFGNSEKKLESRILSKSKTLRSAKQTDDKSKQAIVTAKEIEQKESKETIPKKKKDTEKVRAKTEGEKQKGEDEKKHSSFIYPHVKPDEPYYEEIWVNKVLSDPIVTPCTDEFPTEENEEEKQEKQEKKTNDNGKTKSEFKNMENRAEEKAKIHDSGVDYNSKKKKKGKDTHNYTENNNIGQNRKQASDRPLLMYTED